MNYKLMAFWGLILGLVACQEPLPQRQTEQPSPGKELVVAVSVVDSNPPAPPKDTFAWAHLPDTALVPVEALIPEAVLDIRYATTNNFMGIQVYDCAGCLLRLGAAKALARVQARVKAQGYGLILFDCYRPQYAQHKLWAKTPDPRYVTPPAKGSMHSRGAAVDLSLVDSLGRELDMGTPFDYFGKEAYWAYTAHSPQVMRNRKILRQAMEAEGFKTVTTEWWHFNYSKGPFKLSDERWECKH